MRFIKKLLIMLMFLTIFLTACKPTPSEELVYKPNENLEDYFIEETDEPVENTNTMENNNLWQETVETAKGMKLVFDGEILPSKTQDFYSLKVKPVPLTNEQINKIAATLSVGNKYYTMGGAVYLKEDIEADIVRLKKEKSELENAGDAQGAMVAQENIDRYQKAYEGAYTQAQLEEMKEYIDFNTVKLPQTEEDLVAYTQIEDKLATFLITNYMGADDFSFYTVTFKNMPKDHLRIQYLGQGEIDEIVMSKEEAVVKVEELIKKMGLDYMEIAEISTSYSNIDHVASLDASGNEYYYTMYLTRTYKDAPMPYVAFNYTNEGGVGDGQMASFRSTWQPEQIRININDSGICEFEYLNPIEIIEEEGKVETIPFEEIRKRGIEQLKLFFADENNQRTFNINKVSQGMQFTPIKDNLEEYRLMPCWVFYGASENSMVSPIGSAVVVINGVDGSIVR